jgi:hypothetical protein
MARTNLMTLALVACLFAAAAVLCGAHVFDIEANNTQPEPAPANSTTTVPQIDDDTFRWINTGVLIAAILVGLLWCFVGYRVLRISLFFGGFILFYFVTFEALHAIPKVDAALAPWIVMAIAAGVGILGGILVIFVFKAGIFLMGFILGSVAAVIVVSFTPLNTIINENIQGASTFWVFIACVVGLGIVVGILAVIFVKFIVVIVTACNGSFVIIAAVDRITEWNLLHVLTGVFNRTVPLVAMDWKNYQTYVIFGGLILLAVAGIVIQFRFTARGHRHDEKDRKPSGEDEYPLLHGIQDA